MKIHHFLSLAISGVKAMFNPCRPPILATIILTNRCNLKCKHCAVSDQDDSFDSYSESVKLMQRLYREGVKILFFCGGEVFLWNDNQYNIHHLVLKAKEIGFLIVCVVTNGTISADIPEADLVFLSIDGMENSHDLIRGSTFKTVLYNLEKVNKANIVFYMAINDINLHDIENVTKLAAEIEQVKAISFNFHTPYQGTECLSLNNDQKQQAVDTITNLIHDGAPVFNLPIGLEHYISGDWNRPCYQCVVYDKGQMHICGRCSGINRLCEECGYLFAIEFSLLLKGNIKAIREMIGVYLKYC